MPDRFSPSGTALSLQRMYHHTLMPRRTFYIARFFCSVGRSASIFARDHTIMPSHDTAHQPTPDAGNSVQENAAQVQVAHSPKDHAQAAHTLVKMAHDIGAFFEAMPDQQQAARDVANHIQRFWEPRMQRNFLNYLAEHPATPLSDIVRQALVHLRQA